MVGLGSKLWPDYLQIAGDTQDIVSATVTWDWGGDVTLSYWLLEANSDWDRGLGLGAGRQGGKQKGEWAGRGRGEHLGQPLTCFNFMDCKAFWVQFLRAQWKKVENFSSNQMANFPFFPVKIYNFQTKRKIIKSNIFTMKGHWEEKTLGGGEKSFFYYLGFHKSSYFQLWKVRKVLLG